MSRKDLDSARQKQRANAFLATRAAVASRWVIPAMAMLYDRQGEKFVSLWRGLGASQGGIRNALDIVIERGWVERNPGYGHPMRPEYILTKSGMDVGKSCSKTMSALEGVSWRSLSKWSMPIVLLLTNGPYRFKELSDLAEGVTERALVMCLKPLVAQGIVHRDVADTFPPSVTYSLTPVGEQVGRAVLEISAALSQ